MWTREQFEKAAAAIAKDFANGQGSVTLNQLACKVAESGGLNPDGIRTLVRLANTDAFQELFAKQAGQPDRMFEFEVGDPEVVISELRGRSKVASAPETESCTDTLFRDFHRPTVYDSEPDAPLEKRAEASAPLSSAESKYVFDRALERIESEKKAEEIRWGLSIESAANILREVKGRTKEALYSDLIAASNGAVYEDIVGADSLLTGKPKSFVLSPTKIASIINTTAPTLSEPAKKAMKYLEQARTARYNWNKCAAALEAVRDNF